MAKKPKPKSKQDEKPKDDEVYLVSCDCPTELTHNPCRVVAASVGEAKKRFFAKNGIVDTDHPITVTPESKRTDEQRNNTGSDQNQPARADQGSDGGT